MSCCEPYCPKYSANAIATGYAKTSTGDIVTATASASAGSDNTYEEAYSNAYAMALQYANIEAQNSANIIDQTLEIVETEDIGGNGGVVTKSLIPDKDLAYHRFFVAHGGRHRHL